MGCSLSVEVQEQENVSDTQYRQRPFESIELQKCNLKRKYGRTREVSIVLQQKKCQQPSVNENIVPQLDIGANTILKSRIKSHEKGIN